VIKYSFIPLNVKISDGSIQQQYVNVFHIVKIFENEQKEIIVELTNYEELKIEEFNIPSFLERFM
jgi:hypothetical protein